MTMGQLELDFDGATFDAALDSVRLSKQAQLVFDLMRDGQYRTLAEIVRAIGCGSEAGVSARLRDFRKQKFGGFEVDRRRRGVENDGVFEYQLRP